MRAMAQLCRRLVPHMEQEKARESVPLPILNFLQKKFGFRPKGTAKIMSIANIFCERGESQWLGFREGFYKRFAIKSYQYLSADSFCVYGLGYCGIIELL